MIELDYQHYFEAAEKAIENSLCNHTEFSQWWDSLNKETRYDVIEDVAGVIIESINKD